MQNVLEQGPDFWRWFDTTRFSYHCIHPIHTKVFSIRVLATTFQSNCDEDDSLIPTSVPTFSLFFYSLFVFVFIVTDSDHLGFMNSFIFSPVSDGRD